MIKFERYVDDIILHCCTEKQAEFVLAMIRNRFIECGLKVHPDKTKIVYCRREGRLERYKQTSFDFLGFSFCPRLAPSQRNGGAYLWYTPGISKRAQKAIASAVRDLNFWRTPGSNLEELVHRINPLVRGWFNYYGRYYPSLCKHVLRTINYQLIKWLRVKFKRYKYHKTRAHKALQAIHLRNPNMFEHWKLGVIP
jgi:RNA-directed DNA polymerase